MGNEKEITIRDPKQESMLGPSLRREGNGQVTTRSPKDPRRPKTKLPPEVEFEAHAEGSRWPLGASVKLKSHAWGPFDETDCAGMINRVTWSQDGTDHRAGIGGDRTEAVTANWQQLGTQAASPVPCDMLTDTSVAGIKAEGLHLGALHVLVVESGR